MLIRISRIISQVSVLSPLLILPLILIYTYSYFAFELDFTIALLLLSVLWVIDIFLKLNFGLGLTTALADLSLTALGFSVSYAINEMVFGPLNPSISLEHAFVLVALTGLLWFANLMTCRGFRLLDSHRQDNIWTFAILLFLAVIYTFSSVSLALLPYL
jgi:hypothetical protein